MKLLFEKVNDYDYNNTGQFKCYYMLTTPNRDKFWQGKKFPEWELDILASEGKTIKIVNTIDLHLDQRVQNMRTDELKELEKLGFELSDLLPRLEMIQHASETVTALNQKADNTTTAYFATKVLSNIYTQMQKLSAEIDDIAFKLINFEEEAE